MQEPDTKPGNYYVTAIDGGKTAILVGPFPNNHQAALDKVDIASDYAQKLDDRAYFWAFGTARFPLEFTKPGILNAFVGYELPKEDNHVQSLS